MCNYVLQNYQIWRITRTHCILVAGGRCEQTSAFFLKFLFQSKCICSVCGKKNADSLVCNLRVLTDAPHPPLMHLLLARNVSIRRGLDCGRRWTSFTFTPHFHHRHHEEMDVSNTLYSRHSQMMSGLTETKTQYVMKQRVTIFGTCCWLKMPQRKRIWGSFAFSFFQFSLHFPPFLFLCCSIFFLASTFGADILFPPRCHIGSGICPPWFSSLALPNLFL